VEAPQLQRLHKTYFSQGFRLIGVTQMDPTIPEIRAFLKEHGITYPILLDPKEKTGAKYLLEGHPTGILIDRKGVVRYVHTGYLAGEEKDIEATIVAVLAGKEPPKGDSDAR
jgi:peroxiredoxin